MSCFQVRTDLALEAREGITDADGELRGSPGGGIPE